TDLLPKQDRIYSLSWIVKAYTTIFVVAVVSSRILGKVTINSPEITLEWRGAIQMNMLIYHIIAGNLFLPNFLMARGIFTSYLVISGFGHFHHHWKQPVPRLGLMKLITVMYRVNFFMLAICTVMHTKCLSYYFMPLISFWYTVTFVYFHLFPRVSGHSNYTILKVVETENSNYSTPYYLGNTESGDVHRSVTVTKPHWSLSSSEMIFLLKIVVVVGGIEFLRNSPRLFHFVFHSGYGYTTFFTVPNSKSTNIHWFRCFWFLPTSHSGTRSLMCSQHIALCLPLLVNFLESCLLPIFTSGSRLASPECWCQSLTTPH
ncbi:hypothetical protein EG68_05900, partial [Paragonimus skrjabini miyazakii]